MKMVLLSSVFPFPPVSWWQLAVRHQEVLLDVHEHFQKMTLRNRYYLTGSQGKHLLSIPLDKGRNQRLPMKDVMADVQSNWQIKHWRTLTSCYGRSPFFEFYADELESLFAKGNSDAVKLADWSVAGIKLIARLLGLKLNIQFTEDFQQEYFEDILDVRFSFPRRENYVVPPLEYHQVFQEKNGFIEDCSILDMLFCEGPGTLYLLENRS